MTDSLTQRTARICRVFALACSPALFVACAASADSGGAELQVGSDGGSGLGPVDRAIVLDDSWVLQTAYAGDLRVNGVACGELSEAVPGDEIVSVDRLGQVRIHLRDGDGFRTELLSLLSVTPPALGRVDSVRLPGELVQVAVGDLDPSVPGDEIVAVGVERGSEDEDGKGIVRYISRSGPGGSWIEKRFVVDALVHAIAIGDVRVDRPGNEFVFAGFFGRPMVGYIDASSGDLLVDAVEAPHSGNAKGACVMPDGFVLASDDGTTLRYRQSGSTWQTDEPTQHDEPLARIAAFDANSFAVCGNDGGYQLYRVSTDGSRRSTIKLDKRDQRLRGSVIADIDPSDGGVEAATAGYDGEIRVIRLVRDADSDGILTSKKSVARDSAKIHHLTSGEIDGFGTALVSCGYSGDVLVVAKKP